MKFILTSTFLVLFAALTFGQEDKDRQLRAYLDSKQFHAPSTGNYVEFYLQFVGYSINYKGVEGTNDLQGDLAVKMILMQGDSIVQSDAYRLATPIMKDSLVEDFYDVKRFALAPGKYEFHLELSDLNSQHEPLVASQSMIVEDFSQAISISDIQIAEVAAKGDENSPFYKSGYEIIPRLSTFYPEQLNQIPAYFEIYNTTTVGDSVFGLKQSIIDANTEEEVPGYTMFSKYSSADVVPVLRPIDIATLPTGKYFLTYTVLSRSDIELAEQSYVFERSNDADYATLSSEIILDPSFQGSITDDSVGFYLESLIPISRPREVKNLIAIAKAKDADEARKHIQQFWMVTAPDTPYESWMNYKAQVQLVERVYRNNFQEGFETDRGRVYLQYGSPTNIIEKLNSPSEYPYEIWQYNKIGRFSNKRFIFYNPDLVNNAYRLLHSDMIGELKNPSWPRELSKRNSSNGNVDDPNAGNYDHFGGNSDEWFRQY